MASEPEDVFMDPGPSRRPASPPRQRSFSRTPSLTRSSSSGPSTFLRTLSSSSSSTNGHQPKISLRIADLPSSSDAGLQTSLSHLDLPVHLQREGRYGSASEEEDHDATPGRKRAVKATYSSLPPSPRIQAIIDFKSAGVGHREIEKVLGDLARGAGKDPPEQPRSDAGRRASVEDVEDGVERYLADSHGLHRGSDGEYTERFLADAGSIRSAGSGEVDGVEQQLDNDEDTFWPARSRRTTNDIEAMTFSPESSGGEGHPMDTIPEIGKRTAFPDASPSGEHLHSLDSSEEDDERFITPKIPSLWDIMKDDAGDEVWDGWIVDGKWERIANFLAVPIALERTIMFGSLLCLDGFLYNFTVLPIRSTVALIRLLRSAFNGRVVALPLSHLHAILRMLLVLIPTAVLLGGTNASKMYHSVRGQDTIKLYVIFNALEIADRLCGAFGQDVLDTLFARETLAPTNPKRGKGRKREQARPFFFFMLALGYVLAHSLIFFYMLVSLNVAINSYDYTLLSLLISNQFVEIKGSVFKKFEKENLFQIMCADIVERFQLSLMLCVIAIRNLIEMSGSDIAFLPKSFMRGKGLVDAIFSPVLFVIVSEVAVDWLKHAFITKFNHVRASVYGRYADVLAKDVLVAGSIRGDGRRKLRNSPVLLDQSPLVARRLGFASIPLACLVLRVGAQVLGMLTLSAHSHDEPSLTKSGLAWVTIKWIAGIGVGVSAWGCLVALKVLLGVSLLSYSVLRQDGMEAREAEDAVNDFGRSAVGESKEETAYNKQTTEYLSRVEDDLEIHTSPTSTAPALYGGPRQAQVGVQNGEKESTREVSPTEKKAAIGKKGKKWKLEEVERWTMVKRIW